MTFNVIAVYKKLTEVIIEPCITITKESYRIHEIHVESIAKFLNTRSNLIKVDIFLSAT